MRLHRIPAILLSWLGQRSSMKCEDLARPAARLRFALALVSAAMLAYEVLLTRLFSIIQWHHFAYMVISMALLGFGASGTALAFARHRLQPHVWTAFAIGAALFGITAVASFAIAQRLPFNAL